MASFTIMARFNPRNHKIGHFMYSVNKRFLIFQSDPFKDYILKELRAVKITIGKDRNEIQTAIYDLYENQFVNVHTESTFDIRKFNDVAYSNGRLPLMQLAKLVTERMR